MHFDPAAEQITFKGIGSAGCFVGFGSRCANRCNAGSIATMFGGTGMLVRP
jgi:hypothetical protein